MNPNPLSSLNHLTVPVAMYEHSTALSSTGRRPAITTNRLVQIHRVRPSEHMRNFGCHPYRVPQTLGCPAVAFDDSRGDTAWMPRCGTEGDARVGRRGGSGGRRRA